MLVEGHQLLGSLPRKHCMRTAAQQNPFVQLAVAAAEEQQTGALHQSRAAAAVTSATTFWPPQAPDRVS